MERDGSEYILEVLLEVKKNSTNALIFFHLKSADHIIDLCLCLFKFFELGF